jgi:hypothetical protein
MRRLAVIRPRTALYALAVLTAWALAGPLSFASAAGLASFRLSNNNPSGTTPATSVIAGIIPAGAVEPPAPSLSPLTILAGSSGFNPNDLQVALGDGADPSGNPIQALQLNFGKEGFAPGGVLNFSLSLSPSFNNTLQLLLPPDSNGLQLLAFAPTTTSGSSNNPPTGGSGTTVNNSVPEPLSIAIWTSLAGLGWVRSRGRKRSA